MLPLFNASHPRELQIFILFMSDDVKNISWHWDSVNIFTAFRFYFFYLRGYQIIYQFYIIISPRSFFDGSFLLLL